MNDDKNGFSRRSLFRGAAGIAGGYAASRMLGQGVLPTAFGQTAAEKPALVVVGLWGGYNALFSTPISFLGQNNFGVTQSNMKALPNNLYVDASTLGTLSPYALNHMATIGVDHNQTAHPNAQRANWSNGGTRSYPLMLASAMGGDYAQKCVVLGTRVPAGPKLDAGVSMQVVTDLGATIAGLGGAVGNSTDRSVAASGLDLARTASADALAANPISLSSVNEGYKAGVEMLSKPAQQFDYTSLANAYGLAPNATAITDVKSQMAGAELMIRAGSNVAIVYDGPGQVGWDSHGDKDGSRARNTFKARILPSLTTFVNRMLELPNRNVVIALFGDFARDLPGSDHANSLAATVIGKYVKNGSTGRVTANVGPPNNCPGMMAYWAHVSDALKVPTNPFGTNPHGLIL
jgi:hypothetical protein